ncbi:MAG TPA: hypothetical protein VGM02_13435 [Acidobacteriaceae bacterium]|jgi:hypothetical protein
MRKIVQLSAVTVFGAWCFAASAAGTMPSGGGVVGVLQKKYLVTEMTPDHEQITKDGTTMVMKAAGVYSVPTTTMMMVPDNKVVDGKVQAPNMFLRVTLTKAGAHVLQTGDKVYITKMDSKSPDVLQLTIVTVDQLDVPGKDDKKKFDANVTFHFKKGYLDEAPPEEVEQAIESVMAPDEGGDQGGGNGADAQQGPQQQGPPQRPAPVRAAAPPPPPPAPAAPAAPPPTITIGESSTEVLQAMGLPLQMIDLGKKKTYVYKNMKVVFINDKVSDVQ